MSETLKKFYKHAEGSLEFLSRIDYSELSRAKNILRELDAIPAEHHQAIKDAVLERLKDFYHISKEHLEKYQPSDLRIIDELATRGRNEILQRYGIAKRKDAKGSPRPYDTVKYKDAA